MINAGLMSSATDQWPTPQDFYDDLDAEFHFETDVCADAANAKCARYFTVEQDGLAQEWTGVCWLNPPYGRELLKWLKKAYESSLNGATVVCLVPSRTDTKWWHQYAMRADEIRLIPGRLKFGGSKNSAPFPSAVLVFRGKPQERPGPRHATLADAIRAYLKTPPLIVQEEEACGG